MATWLPDGRNMRLRQSFAYIDSGGERWTVPPEARIDGASIPQFLWTLTGGPFEGKYRDASVVHDWYCDVRTRAWRAVHRMFYEAMLTSGVGPTRARMMYAGVMLGGPKWGDNTISNALLSVEAAAIAQRSDKPETEPRTGIIEAINASTSRTPAVRYSPTATQAERVIQAAACLDDLDAIDTLVAGETLGLQLTYVPG